MADSKTDEATENERLEAQGLIAHSYDSLFRIDKRVRTLSDWRIPLRNGLTFNQISTFFVMLFVALLSYVFLMGPIVRLTGVNLPWWFAVLWIFGIPVLAAQQIIKPMPHGKSIDGTLSSVVRVVTDDKIHRRGRPIPPRKYTGRVQHNARQWFMAAPYSDLVPGEGDYSDPQTERDMTVHAPLDLSGWRDTREDEYSRQAHAQRITRTEDTTKSYAYRRGTPVGVITPKEQEDR